MPSSSTAQYSRMIWWLSLEALLCAAEYMPLEAKLWFLQAFLGRRNGAALCWLMYQVAQERGSLRTIMYDGPTQSIWSSAVGYMIYTPNALGAVNVLARATIGVFYRTFARQKIRPPVIPLLGGWEVIE